MEPPRKGDVVIVLNVLSNGTDEQAAIVTRVWDQGKDVNVMVLPDSGVPNAQCDVPFFETREAARLYLKTLDEEIQDAIVVAFWPRREFSFLN